MASVTWTRDELDELGAIHELHISSPRRDGTWRPFSPIWVVVVGEQVYVRTWQRRDTGWYGGAVRTGKARIQLQNNEIEVDVVASLGPSDEIDRAYRSTYGRPGDPTVSGMVTAEAVASTLRLTPTA